MRASKTGYREVVAVKSLMWGVSLSLIVVATAVAQPRERLDVSEMPRPIEALDSVWIEELTTLEVRDAMRDGKTIALILTGGIEQNGPYLATGKHNYVLRVMGEKIARELGNALIAPIVTLEPGDPEKVRHPGTVYPSTETYKAVLKDMATSLKTQGFEHVFLMGDSGGNQTSMQEVCRPSAEMATEPRSKWSSSAGASGITKCVTGVEISDPASAHTVSPVMSAVTAAVTTKGRAVSSFVSSVTRWRKVKQGKASASSASAAGSQ